MLNSLAQAEANIRRALHVQLLSGRTILVAIHVALIVQVLYYPSASAAADERPNIILMMSDDMGYSDIGCYGSAIDTPNLDRLAAGGLRFTQFYNTARCCPTRASLLTGLYPHQAGVGWMMSDNGVDGYRGNLNNNCRTIAEVLHTAGYRTYMSGKWHVTRHTPIPMAPSITGRCSAASIAFTGRFTARAVFLIRIH